MKQKFVMVGIAFAAIALYGAADKLQIQKKKPAESKSTTNATVAVQPRLTNATQSSLTNSASTNAIASTNAPKAAKVVFTPVVKPHPVIIRGPYLQCGTSNSVVIRWRTDVPCPSVVRYGLSLTNLNKKTNSSGVLADHVVLIPDLKPDTRYYYSIGIPDCPILVSLTNNLLSVSTTNGGMAVSTEHRVQFANVTNTTLFLSIRKNDLVISNAVTGSVLNTSNEFLIVSTTNNTLHVMITNNNLFTTSSNAVLAVKTVLSRSGRTLAKSFVVGTTNLTLAKDTNTFFYTAPVPGTRRPIRVLVFGDPGTRKDEQKRVRNAYAQFNGSRRTDVWLLLGDNAYNSGTDVEYQGSIFQTYEQMLRYQVLWPTLGNHDAGTANSVTQSGVYYDIFTLPTQGQAGGLMSGTEAYYSFDYGNIHIVCLDSANSDRSTNGLMVKWLQADLAANRQDWCIAYCHHPPYTKGSHDSDKDQDSEGIMRDMRGVLMPVLEEGGVDLMLTGHSHCYERSYLLDSHYRYSSTLDEVKNIKSDVDGREDGQGVYHKPTLGPAPHEGTVYLVAGSSGQKSGGSLLHPAMYASLNVLGCLVLDFDGQRLDSTFIDDKAQVREYFTILKGSLGSAEEREGPPDILVQVGENRIPEHLQALFQPISSASETLSVVTNARPSDQDQLLIGFRETSDPALRARLAWALACIGDVEVVTNFMRFLTNDFRGKDISMEEENVCLEVVKGLGLLAGRYEAPFEFLKKAISPLFWQTNNFLASPRGYESAGLLASCSIQALGLSGRPEIPETLTSLQKKSPDYKIKEYPDYMRSFSQDIEGALKHYELYQKVGVMAFQRRVLENELDARLFE